MSARAEEADRGADASARADEGGRERLRRAIGFCLLAFAVLRVAMFLIGLAGVALIPPAEPVGVPGWPPRPVPDLGWQAIFTAWERFDALWFLRIADGGYRVGDGSAAFFPLYPITIRAVSLVLGGAPLAAATLVSNAAFVGALIVIYLLTAEELSERAARTTVLLLCAFPTSHFFLMPYSESLFLLLVTLAFRDARRGRWWAAGAAGALASLTRSVGIVLVPALLVEALHQRREGHGSLAAGLAAAGATGLGLVAYLTYWGGRTGEWLAPATEQATWHRTFSWPWVTLSQASRAAFEYVGYPEGGYWLADWLIVFPMLAAAVYAASRLRPSYAVYLWGGLLIPLTFVFEPRPLMSMPRFLLPLFPAFWGAVQGLERLRIPRMAALAAGVMGLGILSLLTANWYYIF